jgi:23S rRNA U2552 (ribose-2'-O)-methylase RlmE/FtsJ
MNKDIIRDTLIKEYEYRSYNSGSIHTPLKSKLSSEANFREIVNKNVTSGTDLVVHPDDRTTDFLDPCYADLSARVLTSQRDMFNLRENMRQHERIIMMGHGSPGGLMMPVGTIYGVDEVDGELKKYSTYNLGASFVDILKTKPIVAVWCNADKFVVPHDLHGIYTGMVISEMCEANYCNVHKCNVRDLEESNTLFTIALKEAIKLQSPDSVRVFKEIYNNPKNEIMNYNRQRFYYR